MNELTSASNPGQGKAATGSTAANAHARDGDASRRLADTHRTESSEVARTNQAHIARIQGYLDSDRQHAAAPAGRLEQRSEATVTKDHTDPANYRFRASDLHFSDAGYTLRQQIGGPAGEAEIRVKAHDNNDGTATIAVSRWGEDGQGQIEVPRGADAQHIQISVTAHDQGGSITINHPSDVGVAYKSDTSWTIKEVQTAALGSAKTTAEAPARGDRTQDRRDDAGSHQAGSDRKAAPIPFATKEEQWEVAKDSARNWLIDRLVGLAASADPTSRLPGGGLLEQAASRLVQDLRAPEPTAHPANVREYELRESYQTMQHALSVAEAAGTLVVGPIVETAAGLAKVAEAGEAAKLGEGAVPRTGVDSAGPELDREARQLGGTAHEPHPRELGEAGPTPDLDPRQQPFAKPTVPRQRGEPSAPENLTGTDRRTGMAFHERNAAEIVNNLRVEYDPVAGRPVRLSYDVDAKTLSQTPESTRSFARDWSTEGAQGTNAAYAHSGYDRGHLVQREAFKGSQATERAADLHTHVVPMKPDLNRGPGSPWRKAEQDTCVLASKHGAVRVEVEPRYAKDPPRLRDGTPIPETINRRVYGPDGTLLRDDSFRNYQ